MIFISTNFLEPEHFSKIFDYIPYIQQKLDIPIGIEIFPFWDTYGFEDQIIDNLTRLKEHLISFHDPYQTDHTSLPESDNYNKTLKDFIKTLSYNRILHGNHIVYHHNNCKIERLNKSRLLDASLKNLSQIKDLCHNFGTEILVENAGTLVESTMLLNQEEFEHFCFSNDCNVLIDIGHAYCNQWDIEKLIHNLGTKIKAYHIHNNYGDDSHNRIKDGGLNYKSFLAVFSQITPCAKYIFEYSSRCQCTPEDFCEDIQFLLSHQC